MVVPQNQARSKPADLPVEMSSKFEFVLNMKAAKALGLAVPSSIQLIDRKVSGGGQMK